MSSGLQNFNSISCLVALLHALAFDYNQNKRLLFVVSKFWITILMIIKSSSLSIQKTLITFLIFDINT